MVSRKHLLRITMALLLTLVLTVAFGASAQGTHPGGRLVVADAASNVSLDPFVSAWHSTFVHYALYATLFVRDANLDYVGFWRIPGRLARIASR